MDIKTPEETRQVFKNANGSKPLPQLVVLSACDSQKSADCIVEAGIKHVIAVRDGREIKDTDSKLFFKNLYLNLLKGNTLCSAFENARASIPSLPQSYILLPRNGDHNVRYGRHAPHEALHVHSSIRGFVYRSIISTQCSHSVTHSLTRK